MEKPIYIYGMLQFKKKKKQTKLQADLNYT